jgi:hypothetical protein
VQVPVPALQPFVLSLSKHPALSQSKGRETRSEVDATHHLLQGDRLG